MELTRNQSTFISCREELTRGRSFESLIIPCARGGIIYRGEVGRDGMGVIYTVVKLSTYEVAKGHKSWL